MDVTPTRTALLELREERIAMQEGYAFLDEKRVFLAGEIVRQLLAHEEASRAHRETQTAARDALRRAVTQLGLEALQAAPGGRLDDIGFAETRRNLLGVELVAVELSQAGGDDPGDDVVARTATAFRRLAVSGARLAAAEGNLRRLYAEYLRTERRARALEDVLLPELAATLTQLEGLLEAQDLEEAIRVRAGR